VTRLPRQDSSSSSQVAGPWPRTHDTWRSRPCSRRRRCTPCTCGVHMLPPPHSLHLRRSRPCSHMLPPTHSLHLSGRTDSEPTPHRGCLVAHMYCFRADLVHLCRHLKPRRSCADETEAPEGCEQPRWRCGCQFEPTFSPTLPPSTCNSASRGV